MHINLSVLFFSPCRVTEPLAETPESRLRSLLDPFNSGLVPGSHNPCDQSGTSLTNAVAVATSLEHSCYEAANSSGARHTTEVGDKHSSRSCVEHGNSCRLINDEARNVYSCRDSPGTPNSKSLPAASNLHYSRRGYADLTYEHSCSGSYEPITVVETSDDTLAARLGTNLPNSVPGDTLVVTLGTNLPGDTLAGRLGTNLSRDILAARLESVSSTPPSVTVQRRSSRLALSSYPIDIRAFGPRDPEQRSELDNLNVEDSIHQRGNFALGIYLDEVELFK